MLKASPNYHQGVNFIQISSLPADQQEAFNNWIPTTSVMQMNINNIELNDCVDYQEYNYWFDYQYQRQASLLAAGI